MPLVGSFLAGAYLGFGGSGLFLFRRGWFFLLGRGTALRRRDALELLELLELLVLPDVPPLTVSSSLLLVTVQSL